MGECIGRSWLDGGSAVCGDCDARSGSGGQSEAVVLSVGASAAAATEEAVRAAGVAVMTSDE